jgi:RNA-directed DNA polymerase
MKRWHKENMLDIGKKLFAKIHKRKFHAHHNHDVHFMARKINEWLPKGIHSMIDGTYNPRCLKRIYFSDEMVDQLHLSDRIFQHVLLKMLKPTFKHVMNPNCFHLAGPSGVKYATERIKQVLEDEKPGFFIRADIKSFYRNIPHHKLIKDLKQYDDPKLIAMLENIIKNPIDTPRGTINPVNGIALRGPLSQFFSGIYLKPLDDALSKLNITYIRFQDDVLLLCKTKRQMHRAKRRMMEILHERHLTLSRKKSRMGSITDSFHFLGIHYQPTQTEDDTKVTHANDAVILPDDVHYLGVNGGGDSI